MWVVDGDGKNLNGFDAHAPWAPMPDAQTGDRHSTSMVNKRHPYIFACFACWDDFRFNPGLVLRASRATTERLMCSLHQDIGTIRYSCNPKGRSDTCLPGCGRGLHNDMCGRNPPYRTWQCSWPPSDLKRMMETHDGMGMWYHGAVEKDVGFEQTYNELVFDSWVQPWEPDLAEMVEAVFVQARGTEGATNNGRALRRRILELNPQLGEDAIPLVRYDPSADSEPFSFVDDGWVPKFPIG